MGKVSVAIAWDRILVSVGVGEVVDVFSSGASGVDISGSTGLGVGAGAQAANNSTVSRLVLSKVEGPMVKFDRSFMSLLLH